MDEFRGSREVESPTGYTGIVSVRTVSTTKYSPITELFETDLISNIPRSIFKKGKEIRIAHTGETNKIILLMDNNAYLRGTQEDDKPIKIIEKCRLAVVSQDGQYIAYISTRDDQLHLYSIASGQSEFLTINESGSSKKD
jgi:hypothetical protein